MKGKVVIRRGFGTSHVTDPSILFQGVGLKIYIRAVSQQTIMLSKELFFFFQYNYLHDCFERIYEEMEGESEVSVTYSRKHSKCFISCQYLNSSPVHSASSCNL